MSLGDLLFRTENDARKVIRKIEKTQKKLIKGIYAVIYNKTCLKENILPAYSNIKLNDEAVRYKEFTKEFRVNLVKEQLTQKEEVVKHLESLLSKLNCKYQSLQIDCELRSQIDACLKEEYTYYDNLVKNRIINKLNTLYEGKVLLPNGDVSYVNLSKRDLSIHEKEFLDLGLNLHLYPKFSKCAKVTELELFYQSVTKLEHDGKVEVNPDLKSQLTAEGTKRRDNKVRGILTPELREAAKTLREDKDIIVRKADKSSSYVVLDRSEYLAKLDAILSDKKKFTRITRNPTDELKKKVNKLISTANAVIDGVHFETVVGEFKAGYLYGTVKTHKVDNPLRPIISQIPTPTYKLAKRLNNIISPYIPIQHTIKSSDEFIQLLHSTEPTGILASLDVESLFTNVPVKATIDIILDYVYQHESLPPPSKLPRNLLNQMLLLCTTEAPFRCPRGKIFKQTDGVAMGSPLGVLFANAYMCHVENKVLSDLESPPCIYKRYCDDIYVEIDNEASLQDLRRKFEEQSVLKFTYELEKNRRLHFLDVDVGVDGTKHVTSVYRKPTNNGRCLNALSECPDRYKRGVVRTYIIRAINTCSTWELIDQELHYVKQMLVNNNYSCQEIDDEIRVTLDKFMEKGEREKRKEEEEKGGRGNEEEATDPETITTLKIYYKNQMTTSYKQDEKTIKNIIHRNVKPKPGNKIKTIIYYQSPKSSQLIMRNNERKEDDLQQTNVVYEYKCTRGDCKLQTTACYVGHTTTTLSRRLTMHLQTGGPALHAKNEHRTKVTRKELVENTTILARENNYRRLRILEAAYIHQKMPSLNDQMDHKGIITMYNT